MVWLFNQIIRLPSDLYVSIVSYANYIRDAPRAEFQVCERVFHYNNDNAVDYN